MTTRSFDLERLRNALFARCKTLWGIGLTLKLLIFVLASVLIFTTLPAAVVAIGGLVLAVLSEVILWLSDRWKSAAGQLHRKLDWENSFGWAIGDREVKDFLARYAGNIESFAGLEKGNFFASTEKPGPRRAIENLRESAWWSMHLSETAWWIFFGLILVVVFGCVLLLNASVEDFSQLASKVASGSPSSQPAMAVHGSIIKIVTSTLLFVISYGLVKLASGYFSFSGKARQIVEKCEVVLANGTTDEVPAIKLWQEYHLSREGAPLIPDWIWKFREKKLNRLWNS